MHILILISRYQRLAEEHGKFSRRIYGGVGRKVQKRSSPRTWKTPPPGFIKVNVNAYVSQEGWVGLGAVARNDAEEVIFAASRRERAHWSPKIVECKAAFMGVKLARRPGLYFRRCHVS
ncbi:hypothetical protein POM88_025395 [Heracleum sosnowskyi]|uniref:RNase H type-1 domain-containing protein n=1 Tax=Heracleum sosnowskyi TaxID=360622 RepID=A0AAD8I453_9APIA|nr:hypothetical protein POM88_025395 [Heracleum sosnowskyi]